MERVCFRQGPQGTHRAPSNWINQRGLRKGTVYKCVGGTQGNHKEKCSTWTWGCERWEQFQEPGQRGPPDRSCDFLGSIPGRGTKIPPAAWCGQKQTNKQTNTASLWQPAEKKLREVRLTSPSPTILSPTSAPHWPNTPGARGHGVPSVYPSSWPPGGRRAAWGGEERGSRKGKGGYAALGGCRGPRRA